jgi:hypothetical protein
VDVLARPAVQPAGCNEERPGKLIRAFYAARPGRKRSAGKGVCPATGSRPLFRPPRRVGQRDPPSQAGGVSWPRPPRCRRRIEAALMPDAVNVRLMLDRSAERERRRQQAQLAR